MKLDELKDRMRQLIEGSIQTPATRTILLRRIDTITRDPATLEATLGKIKLAVQKLIDERLAEAMDRQLRDLAGRLEDEPVGHAGHIEQHLEQLFADDMAEGNKLAMRLLLGRCGLQREGGTVSRQDGTAVAASDCRAYLAALKQSLGPKLVGGAQTFFRRAGCDGAV